MTSSSRPSASLDPPTQRRYSVREFDLLCASAGVDLSNDRVARIANACGSEIDWDQLLRMAEHHGVLALLARNLLSHGRGAPAAIEQSLRASFDANIRRSLWFTRELVRILQCFKSRAIPAVPYKGPVLAESVYGDLALRNFSDLDFLIAREHFESARAALADLGYQPSVQLSAEAQTMELRTGYEAAFDSAAGRYLVELQWGVLPRFYAVDLRVDELPRRAGQASLGGQAVPSLAPEDLLIVLCLHAAKHLWMRMIWLCDIAETVRSQKIDYELVISRARALGISRLLGVSFWLAANLLATELPPAVADVISRDPQVEILGREFAQRMSRGATYDFESTDYFRRILALRERRRDQFRYLWRLAWTPGPADLAAIRLPRALSPLYHFVRIARLIRKMA